MQTSLLLRDILSTAEIRGFYQAGDEDDVDVVVAVAEARGTISTAENGRFTHLEMDEMKLRRYLNERLFISSGD